MWKLNVTDCSLRIEKVMLANRCLYTKKESYRGDLNIQTPPWLRHCIYIYIFAKTAIIFA